MNFDFQEIESGEKRSKIRLIDAISNGLEQAMEKHQNLIIMGQDIAEFGGVFKITKGFLEKFGHKRVRNTPICESSIIETAFGLSIGGKKSIVELQFSDFAATGFNPIVNLLAKLNYRWGQNSDVVLRIPCGGGIGAGPFYSQTNEAWFTKTPGLKVVTRRSPMMQRGCWQLQLRILIRFCFLNTNNYIDLFIKRFRMIIIHFLLERPPL